MGWMVAEDQLDNEQREFINREINEPGNIWVQGFAGSGKSVMLVHALRKKKQEEPHCSTCIVVFTRSLVELFKAGIQEIGLPPNIPVLTYHKFIRNSKRYDYIFCDEVQDLPQSVLENMSQRCKRLYVAGDLNQSIYDYAPGTHEPVIAPDEIESTIKARPFILTRIYRLTRSIIRAVQSIIPRMNILQANIDETRQDVQIRLIEAVSKEEEVKFIWEKATEQTNNREMAVVLLPNQDSIIEFAQSILRLSNKPEWQVKLNRYDNTDWIDLNKHFNNNQVRVEYLGSGAGSLINIESNRNLVLMTYHSAKGMDFDNVFLPFMSGDLYIKNSTLFMVAMTRSKKNLFITYSGYLHEYVEPFKNNCLRQPANNSRGNIKSDNIEDFLDF